MSEKRWWAQTALDTETDLMMTTLTMRSQDGGLGASVKIPLVHFEQRKFLGFYLWQLRRGIAHARAQRATAHTQTET